MKTVFDDGKVRISDLEVTEGFLGSVVIFDADSLYISGPSSIFELIFFPDSKAKDTYDFENQPTLSDVGYILDFSICDINKNLIAIGSVYLGDNKKPSILCIFDKEKKEIIRIDSNYSYVRKFIWKEGILYFKGIDGKGNFCYDTRAMNEQSRGIKELDESYDTIFESHKIQANKIKFKVIKEFNLQPVNLVTFEGKYHTRLKLVSKKKKVNIILDRRYSHVNSVIANANFDKFVLLIEDKTLEENSYILVEILKD
jgi:hypothetical protein